MKKLHVIQHTSADYLGLLEDHLEGRQISFNYVRPFTEGVGIPNISEIEDGLILLGAGPWGSCDEKILPTLAQEIELARHCLISNKIVIGFGLGAQILALAGEGGVKACPLEFSHSIGKLALSGALNNYLPQSFPAFTYMRDFPIPPDYALILARDEEERPIIFQMGETAFGFTFHPGIKRAIAEDLIMEFAQAPNNPAPVLDLLAAKKHEIEDALVQIMTGLVQITGLMR